MRAFYLLSGMADVAAETGDAELLAACRRLWDDVTQHKMYITGGIGPSQSDYFQATKGHGHGDYRVPVLAPASIGEAMELMATAFELAERYRTPVMLVADGILGQAMEPVDLRFRNPKRHVFDWALTGAAGRPARIIKSIDLQPEVLERRNLALQRKYAEIARQETLFATECIDDAEYVVVAYGTAARVARSAIEKARATGIAWVSSQFSNHAGPASLYATMPLKHDMIGLYFAVGNANHLPPWGGLDMLRSTNPIAAAMENPMPPITRPAINANRALMRSMMGRSARRNSRGHQWIEA